MGLYLFDLHPWCWVILYPSMSETIHGLQTSLGGGHVDTARVVGDDVAVGIGHGGLLDRDLTSDDLGYTWY